MKALFLSSPKFHEDSAYLFGRLTGAADAITLQRIHPGTDIFEPANTSIDVVVDRSLSNNPQFFASLHGWAEKTGIPVTNPPLESLASYDKRTYKEQYPDVVPPTIVASTPEDIFSAYQALGNDVVVKDPFGAFGNEVERIRTVEDLETANAMLNNPSGDVVVQPYLPGLATGDKRVLMQRDPKGRQQIQAWLKRVPGPGQWKANLSLGGHPEPCELTEADRALIDYVAEHTALDSFGIDIGEDNGRSYLIETNAYHGGHLRFDPTPIGDAYIELIRHLAK